MFQGKPWSNEQSKKKHKIELILSKNNDHISYAIPNKLVCKKYRWEIIKIF